MRDKASVPGPQGLGLPVRTRVLGPAAAASHAQPILLCLDGPGYGEGGGLWKGGPGTFDRWVMYLRR